MRPKSVARLVAAIGLIGFGWWFWSEHHQDIAFVMILFLGPYLGPFLHAVIWLVSDIIPLGLAFALLIWAVRGFAEQAD